MAIHRLLQSLTFDAREKSAMVAAYDGVIIQLKITDVSDPRNKKVAVAILTLFKRGLTNPAQIQKLVCQVFGLDDTAEAAR